MTYSWIKQNVGMGTDFVVFVRVFIFINLGKIINSIKPIEEKISIKPEKQEWMVTGDDRSRTIATKVMKHEPLQPMFTSTKGLLLVQASVRAVTADGVSHADSDLTESDAPLPIYLINIVGSRGRCKKLQPEYEAKLMQIAAKSAGVEISQSTLLQVLPESPCKSRA